MMLADSSCLLNVGRLVFQFHVYLTVPAAELLPASFLSRNMSLLSILSS